MTQDQFKVLMELKQLYEFIYLLTKVPLEPNEVWLSKQINKEIDQRLQFLGYE